MDSEMPQTIYVSTGDRKTRYGNWNDTPSKFAVKYIRADLVSQPASVGDAALAAIKRLNDWSYAIRKTDNETSKDVKLLLQLVKSPPPLVPPDADMTELKVVDLCALYDDWCLQNTLEFLSEQYPKGFKIIKEKDKSE